ncbi:HNH endonuclease [uncultured Lentilactobacillus sp.]|uniref:HNH endonuclease n=1 Tax=uncultured Lentilactobacillus sp. TaxID=2805375 RepID=UPI0025942945|nr:HNH endonuclease signature motif containing protein [uncultured Lentilactobacillus sp.]
MKLHICHEVGCQALIPMGQRYCSEHVTQHQKPNHAVSSARNREYNMYCRDQTANKFYHSKEWKKIRQFVAARDYYLDAVTGLPVSNDKIIVDHIVPRRVLPVDKWLDMDNLWCLSPTTHNTKTKIEQSLNQNQLKHCSKRWWIKVLSERTK